MLVEKLYCGMDREQNLYTTNTPTNHICVYLGLLDVALPEVISDFQVLSHF